MDAHRRWDYGARVGDIMTRLRIFVFAVLAWLTMAVPTLAQIMPHYERDTPRTEQEKADLRAKAEAGDAWSQFEMGELYYDWAGTPQDYVEAARWYRMAAGQGQSTAAERLDTIARFTDDHAALYAKAQAGNGDDLYGFAEHEPHMATGLDGDAPKPHWLLLAAQAGNLDAARDIGALYLRAWYLRRDGMTAIDPTDTSRYWSIAYDIGLQSYSLGFEGETDADDIANAIRWLTPAAQADDASATYALGLAYAVDGPQHDAVAARHWLNAAAGRWPYADYAGCNLDFYGRFSDMQLEPRDDNAPLARIWHDGKAMADLTMAPDYTMAHDCYGRATGSFSGAWYFMGYMLHHGLGGARDDTAALAALLKGQNSNYGAQAKAELALIYSDSPTVPHDRVKAYMLMAEAIQGFGVRGDGSCGPPSRADLLRYDDQNAALPGLLKARKRMFLALTPAQRVHANANLAAEDVEGENPPKKDPSAPIQPHLPECIQ